MPTNGASALRKSTIHLLSARAHSSIRSDQLGPTEEGELCADSQREIEMPKKHAQQAGKEARKLFHCAYLVVLLSLFSFSLLVVYYFMLIVSCGPFFF